MYFKLTGITPGLGFEKLNSSNLWSVRIGIHYSALGRKADDNTIIWHWIGTHEGYNKRIP
jgi:hypothetical protein